MINCNTTTVTIKSAEIPVVDNNAAILAALENYHGKLSPEQLKALGFDSWRWDVAKGFSASYFGDYINSSSPYASVGEYWDGNTANLKSWINGTGSRSAAFDFSLYYNALQPAINSGNYG